MAEKKIYVVVRGRNPGVYQAWSGEAGAAKEVKGFSGALFRGFSRAEDAKTWLASLGEDELPDQLWASLTTALRRYVPWKESTESIKPGETNRVVVYTDGASIGNPGPGGYGAVLRFGNHRKELSGGYRLTTNNRMELMACIVALEALKKPRSGAASTPVVIYSDSRYVVDGITEGWAERWRRHGWEKVNGETAQNVDLWARLLALCDKHDVRFRWVKGHAGHPGNVRADQLASEAARQENLPPDRAFEAGATQTLNPHLL